MLRRYACALFATDPGGDVNVDSRITPLSHADRPPMAPCPRAPTHDGAFALCILCNIHNNLQIKKFDLKVASAGTVESFVQASSPAGKDTQSQLGGQALLQKLEGDLEALESHLVELNTYNERLTSEYNEKVPLIYKGKSIFLKSERQLLEKTNDHGMSRSCNT